MAELSNREVLIGKQVHLHLKKNISGREVATASLGDLISNPVMSGKVTGYDSIGMVIELATGVVTLMSWGDLSSYRLIFTDTGRP